MAKMKIRKKSETGLTLLEVMASSVVVLMVAGVSMYMLSTPKEKIQELEMRAQVVSFLSNKLQQTKESSTNFGSLIARDICSSLSSCNASICGTTSGGTSICPDVYNSDCSSSGAQGTPAEVADLDALIAQNPTMCYVKVEFDPTCNGQFPPNDERAQICMKAKWPKKGNTFYEEALTAFFQK